MTHCLFCEKFVSYSLIAIALASITACSGLSGLSDAEKECAVFVEWQQQNVCYRNLAVIRKDKGICEKIVDQQGTKYKENCLYRVQVESGLQDCATIADQQEKDLCYMQLARVKNDKSYCDQISGPPYKDPCVDQFK